jgi:hypothetical protein
MLLCLTLYYFVFQGLFKPSYLFFALFLGHIMVLEVLSYLTLYYFGTGWLPFIVSILLYSTVQVSSKFIEKSCAFYKICSVQNVCKSHVLSNLYC